MARPEKQFTQEQVEQITQMALDNCHIDTIALALGIAKNTLIRHFGTFIKQKRAEGRAELSHAQRTKAIKDKDSTMLIWRGKQDLDQRDKKEMVVGGVVGIVHTAAELKLGKKMAEQFAKEIRDDS